MSNAPATTTATKGATMNTYLVIGRNLNTHRTVRDRVKATSTLEAVRKVIAKRGHYLPDSTRLIED